MGLKDGGLNREKNPKYESVDVTGETRSGSVTTEEAQVTNAPTDDDDVTRLSDLESHAQSESTTDGYEITIDGDTYEFIEE